MSPEQFEKHRKDILYSINRFLLEIKTAESIGTIADILEVYSTDFIELLDITYNIQRIKENANEYE